MKRKVETELREHANEVDNALHNARRLLCVRFFCRNLEFSSLFRLVNSFLFRYM